MIRVLGALMLCASPAAAEIDPTNLPGTAVLTFSDEFDRLDLWDGKSGTWETTYDWSAGQNGATLPTNQEQQWYIDALYAPTAAVQPWSVSGGVLNITAAPAAPAIRPLIKDYAFTSGMLTTHRSFKQQGGYFEIRAKLPRGQGLWPAIWMLPADGSASPEVDIVEVVGKEPDTLNVTVHSQEGVKASASVWVAGLSDEFHTFGLLWQESRVAAYCDSKLLVTLSPPRDPKPLYLLLNLAVGGKWPGSPDASTPFPAVMQVDYARAYAPR